MPSMSVLKRQSAVVTALAVLGLAACSPQTEVPIVPEEPVAAASSQHTIQGIRLALADRNYGSAASQAKAAQAAFPTDHEVHLLAAQSEAYLGNAGNSAAAFQRAIDAGLTEPSAALSHVAFDTVRRTEPFARIRASIAPLRSASVLSAPTESNPDRIRAGDVEISSDSSGDYIRAGDVVLDTRP